MQTQNSLLCKQIGKIVRNVVQQKPLKLSLASVISKDNLDFVLAGLKNSQDVVQELNLGENGLDDEDLFKICDRLSTGVQVSKLKLKQNNFEDPDPLIALIAQNGPVFTHLDFSKTPFNNYTLPKLCESMKHLANIQELAACQVLSEPGDIAVNYFFSTLAKL